MLLDQLSCSIDALPTCVKYAAVFPLNCRLTDGEIRAVQTFLVIVSSEASQCMSEDILMDLLYAVFMICVCMVLSNQTSAPCL